MKLILREDVVNLGHSGELVEVEPLSGRAEREFPASVGRAEGIYTLHSELATLPEAYPSLQEASFAREHVNRSARQSNAFE